MGQTSNILTLRKSKQNLNLLDSKSKIFLYGWNFLNLFKQSLLKKKLLLTSNTLYLSTNIINFNLQIFTGTQKILKYKKKLIFYKNKKIQKNKNSLKFKHKFVNYKKLNKLYVFNYFLLNILNIGLKKNLILLSVFNLNKLLTSSLLRKIYAINKRFLKTLFARRFNLFIDFMKIVVLLALKKINVITFLIVLSQIFKVLLKKKHTQFIYFLKEIFNFILTNTKEIKGLKFILSGKIKGKTQASFTKIIVGSVPIQSINANIDFNKIHVYTLYGVFGFKLWVHYKN